MTRSVPSPPSAPSPSLLPAPERVLLPLEVHACLVGESAAMRGVRAQLRRISAHYRVLLITGEPGTGKEIAARALHGLSAQPETQFIAHSAASFLSLQPELLAPELAPPGSTSGMARPSLPGGTDTLYLGDVSALTPAEQLYLFQWLKRFPAARNGAQRPRLIFATEHDLHSLTCAGRFDQDLYQYIASVEMLLPPLRSRIEDIREIAAHLLAPDLPPGNPSAECLAGLIDRRALARLESYGWPGNVREFQRVIDLARLHARGGVIEAMHVPPLDGLVAPPHSRRFSRDVEKLDDVVRHHVLEVLSRSSGNKVRAAERLGISRSTLYRMLDQDAPAMRPDPTSGSRQRITACGNTID